MNKVDQLELNLIGRMSLVSQAIEAYETPKRQSKK